MRFRLFAPLRDSLSILRGNTRVCVLFEPMWGIPYALYNFYLGLYMRARGLSGAQIGLLISVGYAAATLASLFSGFLTDRMGRRRALLIFDLLAWPVVLLIYLSADGLFLFALATALNGLSRVASVSFNLLLIEEADSAQRAAAYNFIGLFSLSGGIWVPLSGFAVGALGLVPAERLLLALAAACMAAMMLLRHRRLRESEIGLQLMAEKRGQPVFKTLREVIPLRAVRALLGSPAALKAVFASVLFNTSLVIGGVNSLFFAPYMTEVLFLDSAALAALGALYAWLMLGLFVWVNPALARRRRRTRTAMAALGAQALSLALLTLIPGRSLAVAAAVIVLYSAGFGIAKPVVDVLVAELTQGRERAGIYSLLNTMLGLGTALMGAAAALLQPVNPRLLPWMTAAMLGGCILLLLSLHREPGQAPPAGEPG